MSRVVLLLLLILIVGTFAWLFLPDDQDRGEVPLPAVPEEGEAPKPEYAQIDDPTFNDYIEKHLPNDGDAGNLVLIDSMGEEFIIPQKRALFRDVNTGEMREATIIMKQVPAMKLSDEQFREHSATVGLPGPDEVVIRKAVPRAGAPEGWSQDPDRSPYPQWYLDRLERQKNRKDQ